MALADNPPTTAHTGVEISDPLVLYIARVPGSRGLTSYFAVKVMSRRLIGRADVFLTTGKPLQKVVTAQDVQSSLYFIHMDNYEDDERIRRSGDGRPVESETAPQVFVDAAKEAASKPPRSDSHLLVETQPAIAPITRMPLAPSHGAAQIARKPVSNKIEPKADAPRIRGPRAMQARLHSDDSPALGFSCGKENFMPRRWSEQSPVLQPSSSPEREPQRNTPNLMHNTQHHPPQNVLSYEHPPLNQEVVLSSRSRHQRHSTNCESAGLSLTLIRRYNGNQWNVGKITSICDPGSLWENQSAARQNDLSILIGSPGYARFCTPNAPGTAPAADRVFERHLTILRRPSQGAGLSENGPNRMDNRKPRMSIDFRRLSTPRLDTTSEKATYSKTSPENKSPSIKGYGFYSPWNGLCEFTSGISSHVLKCKHTAPTEGSQAVTVSEIRFNLPTSTGTSSATPRDVQSSTRLKNVKHSSYFSSEHGREPHHAKEPVSGPNGDSDENDHLGLSLGQEHAGGGFGGKKAKLGKLIIEPEGLKMLDLLVAANMGLWWKAYEKFA
ncbi:MAG: hypothetical protein Q9211_004454 [Gyalolechia sp. 1 TL-2023]